MTSPTRATGLSAKKGADVSGFDSLGGWTSIIAGVALLGVLVSAGLMPKPLRGRAEPAEFWKVLCENPRAHLSLHWTYAAFGLVGLGTIPALYHMVAPVNQAWAWYAGALGAVGLAVTARSHLLEVAWDRHVIGRYPDADHAYRQGVHVVAGYALDVPDGYLQHGAVGAWALISSILMLQGSPLPTGLGWLGILTAGFALLTVAGYMSSVAERSSAPQLLTVGVGVGTIVQAAWLFWLGTELLSSS